MFFPNATFLYSAEANAAGAALLPVVNTLLNTLLPEEDFPHLNPALQLGRGVYPGEEWCNPAPLPHAKWHLQTGIALVDFARLADMLHVYLSPEGGDGGDGAAAAATAANTSLLLAVAATAALLPSLA